MKFIAAPLQQAEDEIAPLEIGRSHEFDPKYIGHRLDSLDEAVMIQHMDTLGELMSPQSDYGTTRPKVGQSTRAMILGGDYMDAALNTSDGSLYMDKSPSQQRASRGRDRRTSFNDNGALELLFSKVKEPLGDELVVQRDSTAEFSTKKTPIIMIQPKEVAKASIVTRISIEDSVRYRRSILGDTDPDRAATRQRRSTIDTSGLRSSNHSNPLGGSNHSKGRSRRAGRKGSLVTSKAAAADRQRISLSPVPPNSSIAPPTKGKIHALKSPAVERRMLRRQLSQPQGLEMDQLIADDSMDFFFPPPLQAAEDAFISDMDASSHSFGGGGLRRTTSGGTRRRMLKRNSTDPLGANSYHGPPCSAGPPSTDRPRSLSRGRRSRSDASNNASSSSGLSSSVHSPKDRSSSKGQGGQSGERRRRKPSMGHGRKEEEDNDDEEYYSSNSNNSSEEKEENTRSRSRSSDGRRRISSSAQQDGGRSRSRRHLLNQSCHGEDMQGPSSSGFQRRGSTTGAARRSNSMDMGRRRTKRSSVGGQARSLFQQPAADDSTNPETGELRDDSKETNGQEGTEPAAETAVPPPPPPPEENNGLTPRARRQRTLDTSAGRRTSRHRSASGSRRPRDRLSNTSSTGESKEDTNSGTSSTNTEEKARSPRRTSSSSDLTRRSRMDGTNRSPSRRKLKERPSRTSEISAEEMSSNEFADTWGQDDDWTSFPTQ